MRRRYKMTRLSKTKTIVLGSLFTILVTIAYICGQLLCDWDKFNETVTTVLAIFGCTAFWIEFKSNEYLNEAQFIMELNNQFISNSELTQVEMDLDNYYEKYIKNELTDEMRNEFFEKYSNDKGKRQNLVNYLVHLEGIAAIVNNGVLHLDIIDDLMSYRYFIAVNNPEVQKIELLLYKNYYKGCFDIYVTWKKTINNQKVPMEEYDLLIGN